MHRLIASLITLSVALAAPPAHADIFQWEYINPADPSQGKQQSTTLCPSGAGVDAVPSANLYNRNLTMAYLIGADLTGANGYYANLTNADLSQANLTNANFSYATLTDADFTGAEIRGTAFTEITLAQLYSTANYQAHDLSGIRIYSSDLSGANFSGFNLTGATLVGDLTGADFTNAEVRGASFGHSGITLAQLYSTASYAAHDLSGISLGSSNLSGANFSGYNLAGAYFFETDLAGADLSRANLSGAAFSTAGGFRGANLSGADLSQANLTNARFIQANLEFADLSQANLTNSYFYYHSSNYALEGADFTGADWRGGYWYFAGHSLPSDANTTNLIWPNGHIDGLDLDAGGLLVLRDHDFIPVTVDHHFVMGPGGTLRMVFEADAWDSTISFAAGIPVTLGGTLELTFADNVNLASQLGRTFELFNWTGVNPTGAFAVSSPYAWDLSNLYTTGQVTLTAVPEPSSLWLVLMAAVGWFCRRRPGKFRMQLLCLLGLVIQSASANAAALRTVALSGQPAPGTLGGANFLSFDPYYVGGGYQIPRGPVLNDSGQVALRANLTGAGVNSTNNQGIWSEGSSSLELVARTGNQAPGVPEGMNFARNPALELFTPVLNNAGQTAFYGGLADGSVGIWSGTYTNLALVARDGMQAAGTPEGLQHSFTLLRDYSFYPDLPKLNDAGQISFLGNLTGSGIDYTDDWGIWSQTNGNLELVARGGNQAPGLPDGVNYDSFFYHTGFNAAGQSLYRVILTGAGVAPSNDRAVYRAGSGAAELVVRGGSAAPGTGSGIYFENVHWTSSINNSDRVAFVSLLAGEGVDETNDRGIWSDASGSLELVARRGSPAPGTPDGVNFGEMSFSSFPLLNDAGQLAFGANLSGTGVTSTNNEGIWSGGSDSLALVARTGSLAPGTASGVRFADLHLPALNSSGQTAFRANLTGSGINSTNDRGIWATDESGTLQLIARKGSPLEVAPGDLRTISDLDFVGNSGNSDGRPSGFNNLGQLVFWARFTNGTQGVFVSSAAAFLPGDFNDDGTVDAADYVVWRKNDGTPTGYDAWRANFGRTIFTGTGSAATGGVPSGSSAYAESPATTVPEPANLMLVACGVGILFLRRRYGWRIWFAQPCQRMTIAVAVACSAFFQVAGIPAYGATIEFDSTAKSPAEIPFDPDAGFEAQLGYVSGRVPRAVKGPITGGTNIKTLLGADAFYSQGYTGTNSVVANIEGGHIWNGHETLTHAQQIPNHPLVLGEFDRHATWVASIMGGRRGGANPGAYQEGMAPDAQLFSGALATQWNGRRYTGNLSFPDAGFFDQYRRAFSTGVNAMGRTADVINSSWGNSAGANGSDTYAIGIDGFASANPRTLFVACAHNLGPGPDKVTSPASGYNGMSVAALGPNPPYDRTSSFSSGGPNDYADPVNGTKNDARQVVDIAAPGEYLSAAYYGGETGGNGTTDNPAESGPGPTGLPYGPLGGPDYYSRGGDVNGTSFAAPAVAGGAALLYDAAYSVFSGNADARDARVMKAVLMNSADKTFGWNNGQITHPNGNGGVLTIQGLDNRVGVGRMNLAAAYDQFLTGTTDIAGTASGNLGFVDDIGWDFGQVVSGTTNDYFFDSSLDGGATFTATLTWFRDRRVTVSNTLFDDSFDDLNLELWSVVGGIPASLISESSSLYNESEHFSFALPQTGDYALRVRWFNEVFDRVADVDQEFYGLAWSTVAALGEVAIPEPASLVLVTVAAMTLGVSRHGAQGRIQVSP